MPEFKVVTDFTPSGDQPEAIAQIVKKINSGEKDIILLGATGTGKTATVAWILEKIQRPCLIIEPNKTLAAQAWAEFKDFFPENAVEYFVSYYDYYQPEAYVPTTDTYIEKDSSINDEIDRLRHSATVSLLTRQDVIVVASVSCIYGLGTPEEYSSMMRQIKVGESISRDELLAEFVNLLYERNDLAFERGKFRVKGDIVEIIPVYETNPLRIEFFGDEIESITKLHPISHDVLEQVDETYIFPASLYAASRERMFEAVKRIKNELQDRVKYFQTKNKLLEAQRIQMRTKYDLEMIEEIGTCRGIENYSRHIDGRNQGEPPSTLLSFYPKDFVLIIDESHITVPQIGGMGAADSSRKRSLIDFGFRLPSALDNRPLRWDEFQQSIGQTVYLSATPGKYEKEISAPVVDQIIRPTGLVDPSIEIRRTQGQIDDLLNEIKQTAKNGERVLITTLTKKQAEALTDYFQENNIRVRYMHSDVETLERVNILRDLRLGVFDVLVGINLLREGLDLPEVSLVAILDADVQGFLRSPSSLIQTIGRAARNAHGRVIMYADKITPAMEEAIELTSKRRQKQIAYNKKHNINPATIQKKVRDLMGEKLYGFDGVLQKDKGRNFDFKQGLGQDLEKSTQEKSTQERSIQERSIQERQIQNLEKLMKQAAKNLEFELAAALRDEISAARIQLEELNNFSV
ncbi:MAG: excinuclease ABC subunit UvrB [Bifidobacteriaceae bacterium]|jgi:excinuclease ABC subunit B|nr:excinuclease ABC subunit UvrB [Bifidobacteriaceae bacterium]